MKVRILVIFLLVQNSAMAEEKKEEQPSQPQRILRQPIGLVPDGGAWKPKASWPELIGLSAEEAESKVKLDMPAARIQVVPPDHFVTADYNRQRVRLYLDAAGKVARTPGLG